jgi:predicted double-glycine peptidase
MLGLVSVLLVGCVSSEPPRSILPAESPSAGSRRQAVVEHGTTKRRASPSGSGRIQYASLDPARESAPDTVADPAVVRGINKSFQAVTSRDTPFHITVTAKEPVRSLLEIRHHNVIIQTWDLSCGAAALATLLRYEWADPVTEKEVANGLMGRREYIKHPELVQIQEGFSLLDLKRYVQAHGFKGEGLGQLDLNDLIENAPIMVPVDALGYNHFVIFRGVMGDRVLLADPAWGNRTMTVAKFQRMWLDYGNSMGHVGFLVKRPGVAPVSRMSPEPSDFVTFD